MKRQGRYLDVDIGFGRRLAVFRKGKGLSQSELARLIGATQRMVSNYERRHGRPRAGLVSKMAAVLGVEVDDLLMSRAAKQRAEREKEILLVKLRRAEDLTAEDRRTANRMIEALLLTQ